MKRTLVTTAALCGAMALGACGDSTTCKTDEVAAVTGSSTVQMVVNSMLLPTSKYQFSTDLDGDGTVDNALSNIIQVLVAQGLPSQDSVDNSFKTGAVSILLEAKSTDAALQNASASGLTYYNGKALTGGATPDFSGNGTFAADGAFPPQTLLGNICAGAFNSNAPATTTHPVTVQFKLALVSGAPAVILPTNGAHISFTSSGGNIDSSCTVAGMAGKPCGSLSGSVKIADLQSQVLPSIAGALTAQIQAAPTAPSTKTIQGLFDLGGCTDTNGTVAKASDLIIAPCELGSAPLIQHLLSPDVQIFDGSGNYKPVPKGTAKDSLSIGIGFTTVPAKITL